MTDVDDAFELIVTTHFWDPRDQTPVRNTYYDRTPDQRREIVRHMDGEVELGNGLGTLSKIPRVYTRAVMESGTLAAFNAQHVPALHNATHYHDLGRSPRTRPYQNPRTRRDDLSLLARMKARHLQDDGLDAEEALKVAKKMLKAPRAPRKSQADDEDSPRLSRAKRTEMHVVIPRLFSGAAYLLAFVTFVVALLIENGGRWEGLQRTRIKDVIWQGVGQNRLPILIVLEEPGFDNKPRIHWRTVTCGRLLKEMLRHHPDPLNKLAYLLANPFEEDATKPCTKDVMDKIWGRISRKLKLGFLLGPRSLRVFHITSSSARGKSKSSIRRNVGQVQGSLETTCYIRYDEDDLVDIADNLGFTQGLQEHTCPHCFLPIANRADYCPYCRAWLNESMDVDEARINAYARLGLQLHRRNSRKPS